jgi:uncharacterized lipoprotein YajG
MRKLLISTLFLTLTAATPALADEAKAAKIDIAAPASLNWQGNGTAILVRTEDRRSSTIPGNTTEGKPLQLQGNLAESVNAAVIRALRQQGYTIVPAADAPQRTLILQINRVVYSVKKNLFTSDVTIDAAIGVKAKRGDKTVLKQLQSHNSYEVAFTPSMKRNGEMISETVGDAIQAIFTDPDIAALLKP